MDERCVVRALYDASSSTVHLIVCAAPSRPSTAPAVAEIRALAAAVALEVIVVAVGGSAAMVEAVGVVRRRMIEGRWVVLQDSHQAPYEALREVCVGTSLGGGG